MHQIGQVVVATSTGEL